MASAGFLWQSAYAAHDEWKIAGLAQQASLANDDNQNNHPILAVAQIEGNPATVADASSPCPSNSTYCQIRVETGNNWNTTTQIRDSTWLDFVGVMVHEMGHWLGLYHSSDYPLTDNSIMPTMYENVGNAPAARTIQQDDANGLRTARPTTETNLLNNGHFEWTYAHWGGTSSTTWRLWQGGSGFSLPWDSQGNRYATFVGGSIHQDVFIYNGNYVAGRSMTPRVRARFPSGGGAIKVVIWALDTGQAIYQRTCNHSTGTTWREIIGNSWSVANCSGNSSFVEPTDSIGLRYEVYNLSSSPMEIDHARLEF